MPSRGKHPRQGEPSMGVQRHAHAGFPRIREPGSGGQDRRNHGLASPDAGADRCRSGIRCAESRSTSTPVRDIDGTCSSPLITVHPPAALCAQERYVWERRAKATRPAVRLSLNVLLIRATGTTPLNADDTADTARLRMIADM